MERKVSPRSQNATLPYIRYMQTVKDFTYLGKFIRDAYKQHLIDGGSALCVLVGESPSKIGVKSPMWSKINEFIMHVNSCNEEFVAAGDM